MSQIEVPKIHGWASYAPPAESIVVEKVHGWVLLVPGTDETVTTATRQGFCYGQRVRRG